MMNAERATKWIDLLESSCEEFNTKCIDIIVDQAGSEYSLLPALASFIPPVKWISLFKDLPEEVVQEDAPLLIRIDFTQPLQRQWLVELALQLGNTDQILVLCSLWRFNELAKYLTCCVDAHCGEQNGILRFYDPRIFPCLFSHVLDVSQQKLLQQPAVFWSWLDRDRSPCRMPGNGALPKNITPKLVLGDRQREYLMCVVDVNILLRRFVLPDTIKMTREKLFVQCYEGMIAATEAGLLMDADREAFVKNIILNDKAITF
jgi:hypothetical protein